MASTRTWASEFGGEYEIPGFIRFLAKKGLLNDMSWHNDVSPSFGIQGELLEPDEDMDELAVRLWVDHPLASYREVGGKRFMVTTGGPSGEEQEHWEFDELEEAAEKLVEEIVKALPLLRPGPSVWPPVLEESEGDVLDILWKLREEYYTGGPTKFVVT